MPWTAIAALAGLAGAGAGIGQTIYNDVSAPSVTPTTTTPTTPTTPTTASGTNTTQVAAAQTPVANLLSATSGTANPEFLAMMQQIANGVTGQPGANNVSGQALSAFYGGPTSLSDFINSFTS